MMQTRNTTGRRTLRLRSKAIGLATLALTAFTVACSEVPSAPTALQATKPNAGLLGGVLGLLDGVVTLLTSPLRAKALLRNTAIAADSASAVIGSGGGVITIPSAGLKVVVPSGALGQATQITVKAPAGRGVWYEFAPHGLQFAKPLQVTQDLRGTNYSSLLSPKLKAAYFQDGTIDEQAGTALVTELIETTLGLLKTNVTFPVKHFSGYMVAWGFQDETSGGW
jgi:hypothetical protein